MTTNKHLIVALTVASVGTIGCDSSSDDERNLPADTNRYEVVKVRETNNQVEFYMMDKKTGRICYTTAALGANTKDINGCLLQPFSP
jgi:hypothetical protein